MVCIFVLGLLFGDKYITNYEAFDWYVEEEQIYYKFFNFSFLNSIEIILLALLYYSHRYELI